MTVARESELLSLLCFPMQPVLNFLKIEELIPIPNLSPFQSEKIRFFNHWM